MRHRIGRAFLCVALVFGATIGCNNDKPLEAVAAEEVAPGIANARKALQKNWDQLLLDQQAKQVHPKPLQRYFELKSPGHGVVHREALQSFYETNGWKPVFLDNQGLPNFRARALAEKALDAEKHDLNPSKYLRPAIPRLIQQHQELQYAWSQLKIPTLNDEHWITIEALLENPEIVALERPLPEILARLLGNKGKEADIPALADAWKDRVRLKRARDGSAAILELALADAWLDWAYDMSDGYWEKVDDRANRDKQERIRQDQLLDSMKAMAAATNTQDATAVMESKIPRFQQYERLIEARRRYQDIVANGGWETIRPVSLARGSSGPPVEALKQRLQIEGFFEGTINQSFDRDLENAVRGYQETHQMEVTGRSSAGFWSSINVTAEDRLKQIELTMQRWRESRIGDSDYYVFINVPDFHAEVWRNGVLETRFRVIVGNTRRECRHEKMVYVNATPSQTAIMDHVVLNPYWTVPQRIVNDDILPAFLENPNYFEERDYEHVVAENGAVMVRQLPGPQNALGMVKFMFPNEFDVYMHDTPRKAFFDPPTRAFSHGCVRVQNPLDFLERLLVNDDNWNQRSIDRIFEIGREYRMNLRTPIPVHTEYYVVRVDDEGRVHFNADLYRLDRERLDKTFVREDSCTPPERAPRLRLSSDGEVLQRNEEGELVNARELLEEVVEEVAEQQEPIQGIDIPMVPPGLPPGLPPDMGP